MSIITGRVVEMEDRFLEGSGSLGLVKKKEGFGFSNYKPEVEKRKYTRKRHYLPPKSLSL